ncbi:uncharacterized protein J3D65DRAFT_605953 [Phyllosticta citribraziliensis]|uniref:Uncharacterized protein n=1 Tax=Phyllosticta citribraziliensis TaxID=989973 RepID=A0ABR1LE90_9PEZI
MDPHQRLRESCRDQDLEYQRSLHAGTDATPPRPSMANPDPGNRALISRLQQKVREAENQIKHLVASETGQNQRIKVLEDEVKALKSQVKTLEDRQNTSQRSQKASDNKHSHKPSENQRSHEASTEKQLENLTEHAVNKLNNAVINGHEPLGKKPEGSLLAQTGAIFECASRKSASAIHAEWEWDEEMKLLKEKTQRFEAVVLRTRSTLSPANKTKSLITTSKDYGKDLKTPSSSKNLQPGASSPHESPTFKYGRYEPATSSPSPRNQRNTRTETANRSPEAQKTARTDSVLTEAASQIRSRPTPAKPATDRLNNGKLEWSTRTPARTDSSREKHRRTRYRPSEDKTPKADS